MKIALVYPHQLFEKNPILKDLDRQNDFVLMIEDELFFDQYNFHKLKIELHKKSMSFYKSFLENKKYNVLISRNIENGVEQILNFKKKIKYDSTYIKKIEKIIVIDVVDNYLQKKIEKFCQKNKIDLHVTETPMFLTKNIDIENYISIQKTHKKIYFMKNFYEWQRKRLNILIDDRGMPVGGKWSFDEDNRKKLPKNLNIPPEYIPKNTNRKSASSENFMYAVDFDGAKDCLNNFLEMKLCNFGPYEDAVLENENVLFHSVLSPYLNIGLITPDYVVNKTLKFAIDNKIPLNSLEGFIRQIIGWREYIRLVYIKLGNQIRNKNYFNAERKIPKCFWTATTGILPVDNTIKKLNKTAYTHHIPRLMIMGNFMNLCGFKPDEVYRWFMEMYIDSYDWVMVPNVYSMTLYADGGMITTKPYISGSSYILKMSDFKKDKYNVKDVNMAWNKIWDALFWNFVGTHFEKLKSEGRLGFIGIQYQKMKKEDKVNHAKIATEYIKSMT